MHELSLDFRPQFISCATLIIIFFPTVQIFAEAMSISHHIVSLHSGTETKPFFYYRDGKNPAVASYAYESVWYSHRIFTPHFMRSVWYRLHITPNYSYRCAFWLCTALNGVCAAVNGDN